MLVERVLGSPVSLVGSIWRGREGVRRGLRKENAFFFKGERQKKERKKIPQEKVNWGQSLVQLKEK